MWFWLMLVALALIALLFWFEYLGSETPQTLSEVPVNEPANVAGSQN